jgi:hypothetical protein
MSPNSLYVIVSLVFVIVIGYDIYNWIQDRTFLSPKIRHERLKSKINNTILLLGLTTLTIATLFHINLLKYTAPIPFSDINKITLKDFKGYRKPYQTLEGTKEFAFITTTLSWKKTDNGLEVAALFHPCRSYVYNDKIPDRLLLKHELYHFRITEIFARKCRQELSSLKEHPPNDIINEIIDVQSRPATEMQGRYDYECYHGYIMKEQIRWEKEVDSLLNLLSEYKTPTIVYE